MIIEREKTKPLPYSLHDCVISGMKLEKERLFLFFDAGILDVKQNKQVPAKIRFSGLDADFSFAYLLRLKGDPNHGRLSGRKYYLTEFVEEFSGARLEIVDETYSYYSSKLSGYYYSKRKSFEFFIEIFHTGSMEYIIQE